MTAQVDVLLVATQTLEPADGSAYVMQYFGPIINIVQADNETFQMTQNDWKL